MNSGIYMIFNVITEQFYIGSSYNINYRKISHLSLLRKRKHFNFKLNKSNLKDLIFLVVEYCEVDLLLDRENFYIETLSPSLNISKCAASPMKGRKHSPETLQKLKGRKTWNKGIPRTEEEKLLMSKQRKKTFDRMTEEEYNNWRESRKHINHGKYWKDKNLPEDTKKLIREKHLQLTEKIVCVETGKIYDCQKDAAIDLNIRQGHISEQINGKRKTASGYTFKKYKEV